MDKTQNIQLSLVLPIYNEEESIPLLQKELDRFSAMFPDAHEVVLVNDGSTDQTSKLLEKWAGDQQRVRLIQFEKNKGHQQALIEGIRASKGKYIVTMDADLQDPIDIIPSMLSKGHEGFDVVHTQRISREGESMLRKTATWFFYRVAQKVYRKPIFLDVGDFRLMSSTAANTYFSSVQNPSILRKEIPTLSMNQTIIPYRRHSRLHGKSKFTLFKLAKFAREILKD